MIKWRYKFILLLVFAGLVFFWLVKAPILATYLTGRLKMAISISHMSNWPTQTTMRNFRIRNPSHFTLPNAFKAARTQIDYKLSKLFSNPCVLDYIGMDTVYLGIEFAQAQGTENNWTVISSKIHEEKNEREVIIHKMVLTNITVEVLGAQADALGVPRMQTIERMEFDEIDSRDGFPTKELIIRIFKQAGLEQVLENILNPVKIIDEIDPLRIFGVENEAVEVGADF